VNTPDIEDLARFRESFLYREEAFLVDRVTEVRPDEKLLRAQLDTTRPFPYAQFQRNGVHHPPHVAGADLIAITGSLGCLHVWLFYGVRWKEGWTGFGNRIHRADFKKLARLGPPLELTSRETRVRVGERRIVLRLEFEFRQRGKIVYFGDQTAMFLKSPDFSNTLETGDDT
jgi:hypothetical protein|tara:strand:- start:121 stop:636 length:516 start_codon:yes stop_codon:yes gene_type:complete